MLSINGKEYKINLDLEWGTQKLMRKVQNDLFNPKTDKYLEYIVKDILIPTPTQKELMKFRPSDIERIFKAFTDKTKEKTAEFKKKLSR